ncbi:conserved hypothetical protein [Altererythrobacter sp. B11]|uniref:hypothetical protein n=1 Tax=Altererythrobacter sp. B11 TaxID=2060312 RepID=UPI000DC6E5C0|nr:hypothetical protein [Altererythrobacter sp. B11]BBC72541.1 conserved hypothetical protein [Altererythrobacter sp. B11]
MSDLSPAAHPVVPAGVADCAAEPALHADPAPAAPPLFSARRQVLFCESLAQCGNVRVACEAAGVSPQTAYRARRASVDFARLWDAALVLARAHAEAVLAERALNGVEEAVFYHGEEVATRRRYDGRLLLAHLARLDRRAEQADAALSEEHFDAALAALEQGEALPEPRVAPVRAAAAAPAVSAAPAPAAAALPGGRSLADFAAFAAAFGEEESGAMRGGQPIPAFERRLLAMEAARPEDAPSLHSLGNDIGEVEALQLEAFEAGEPEWWLVAPERGYY